MDLRSILRTMVQNEASDLHLKIGAPPTVRLHGELVALDHAALTADDITGALSELLNDEQRQRFNATREIDVAVGVRQMGRFRVNVGIQRGTPTLTLRAIPIDVKTLEALMLPPVVGELALQHRGLVLVTGITGSGKTTTLAAMIDHINAHRRAKIVTIEDPIEFLLRDNQSFIIQREVGVDTEDFHTGLRHVLRQDPDVLMVGEIRDRETMDTAIKAANTGHLVFATLHTTDAVQTVQRILSFFSPHQHGEVRSLLAENLKGVISLRLIVRADGKGRVPACEVMVTSESIREHLNDAGPPSTLAQHITEGGVQYGMQSFDQSLMGLYQQGRITENEALANATNPAEFRLKLRGIESSSDRTWGTR
ncbi:MAG TPA: PilT/PilU family type 4a pilus ATPase [Gemmatimonadota bacterium]|nr:PilT/PilU family type 4a pilus ATPase [Gemmatimonadota bacterium]